MITSLKKNQQFIDKFQNDIKVIVLVVVDTTFLYNIKDFYRYSMYSFKYFKEAINNCNLRKQKDTKKSFMITYCSCSNSSYNYNNKLLIFIEKNNKISG